MNLEAHCMVMTERAAGYLRRLWVAAIAAAALAACSPPGNDYSEYRNVPSEGWLYGDSLTFTPVFADSVATGRLVAAVSHDSRFSYSTLWLEVASTDPSGRLHRDTVSFILADGFGRWNGNGFGAHLQMADTISRHVSLASGRPVKVTHIMRADTLRSLQRVGLFFLPDD